MDKQEQLVKQCLGDEPDEMLFADDLDDGLIGAVLDKHGTGAWRAVYSRNKCIESIIENSDPDPDDDESPWMRAAEYFDFNVTGAYVGKNTPVFIEDEDWDGFDVLDEDNEECPDFLEGEDDAVVGVVHDHWGTHEWRVVYDKAKLKDLAKAEAAEGPRAPMLMEVLNVS